MEFTTMEFKSCSVRVFPQARYLETVYPDGTKVPAVPHETDAYRAQAKLLGYGDDTFAMCKEHEILHTFLCEKIGREHSPTLWAVAHDFPAGGPSMTDFYLEETAVMDFQKSLNGDFQSEVLQEYVSGIDLAKLREEAKTLLR